MTCVLILGSGPSVTTCAQWPRTPFDHIVAINNAWRVRSDWTHHIHPEDFAPDRHPPTLTSTQTRITADSYVPVQNTFGGFVYAGGTMAFTAGYWALGALKPSVIAFLGCDMVYPATGNTHFYGIGTADPLRDDITLRNLPAKATRLRILAARAGCACINLSTADSVLPFPRSTPQDAARAAPQPYDQNAASAALKQEAALAYTIPSGRYWEHRDRFDSAEIDALDSLWLRAGQRP